MARPWIFKWLTLGGTAEDFSKMVVSVIQRFALHHHPFLLYLIITVFLVLLSPGPIEVKLTKKKKEGCRDLNNIINKVDCIYMQTMQLRKRIHIFEHS